MNELDKVTPYQETDSSKKEQVQKMFDNIAGQYDLLNQLLSFGIDRIWRRKAISMLRPLSPSRILDVATGTADVAIALRKVSPKEIVGLDLSREMLERGRDKVRNRKLENLITLVQGDSEALPFEEGAFDAVTVAFGVRNFGDLDQGLREICRVLRPGGQAMILEFSKPQQPLFRALYFFYFRNVLPLIGKLVSRDARAYQYLPESVAAFPDGEAFAGILKKCGFQEVVCKRLTFGISTIYLATK